jgi:hypothetical protein
MPDTPQTISHDAAMPFCTSGTSGSTLLWFRRLDGLLGGVLVMVAMAVMVTAWRWQRT